MLPNNILFCPVPGHIKLAQLKVVALFLEVAESAVVSL